MSTRLPSKAYTAEAAVRWANEEAKLNGTVCQGLAGDLSALYPVSDRPSIFIITGCNSLAPPDASPPELDSCGLLCVVIEQFGAEIHGSFSKHNKPPDDK
jgi:hypothetical protein